MADLTPQAVYDLAVARGATHDQAVTATAIAMAESNLNPDAEGDTTLEDAEWGPSLGLWQIRSLKAESGTGGVRDASQLTDPAHNADSAKAISDGWVNFTPWSTYTSGAYRPHLEAVTAAVAVQVTTPNGPEPELKLGAKGAAVATLQGDLARLHYPPANSFGQGHWDGIFGQGTLNAVHQFQAHNGLTVDGIVGPLTWAKLQA